LGIREESTAKTIIDQLWAIAGQLVRGPRPGDLNQALMELGATVCTPKNPDCPTCPIRKHCDAQARGDAEQLPIKKKKSRPKPMRAVAAWIERGEKILAVRRPEVGLMAGLWELPGGEIGAKDEAQDRLGEILLKAVGLEIRNAQSVGRIEHVFTHRRLEVEVFRCQADKGRRVRCDQLQAHRWVRPNAILDLAHAGPTRKAMTLFGVTDQTSARAAGRADR
jgi:A/G-specific adenine glycosylase